MWWPDSSLCVLLTGSTRGEDHVRYLEHTLRAAGTSANDGLRCRSNEYDTGAQVLRRHTIVVVEEGIASPEYGRPCLANDLATRRNGDRVRHDVDTRVKEYDPTPRELSTTQQRQPCYFRQIAGTEMKRTLSNTAWMAAVSSVCPSPFAPCDLTLMN